MGGPCNSDVWNKFQKPYKVTSIKNRGFAVKYRWLHKNVSISDIEEAIKSFLQEQGFKTVSSQSKDARRIVGVLRDAEGAKRLTVAITGKPDDFIVDFSAGESAEVMAKFASLITLFGGGPLQLKSLKEKEFCQKIEDSFWDYLEKFIAEKSQE